MSAGRLVGGLVLLAVAAVVLGGFAWSAIDRLITRRRTRAAVQPRASRQGAWNDDAIWPDPTPDPVDAHAAQAMALLTPDALPPCSCEVCIDLTAGAVDAVLDAIASDRQVWDAFDVDTAVNRLLPPSPPVMPGRPEQGSDE